MNDAAHLTPMTHTPARFGAGDALVGMVTAPAGQAPATVACLMFNMGANHRVGPRRINVKLAHALAARGVSSLRFDLGGIGDSDAPAIAADLPSRALRDLQAGMDLLEDRLGIGQFVIVGMCSGAEHAMSTAAVDARVVGLSLFDGYAFPQWRTRWERTLRRALAAPAHPSFAGKTRRWLKRGLLRGEAAKPMPGFFSEAASPEATAAWFGKTMALLAERNVALQLLYSGSLHVCDHDRDQLGPFRVEPFAQSLHYEFMRKVDHTVCTVEGQQLYLRSVSDWVADRCFGTSAERRGASRPAAAATRPMPAKWAAP
ncbi:alpha/beta hydrolase family protein [Variovorax sp. RKNM96]|uniref:alpha/beta hydrolase family protein n=1 Tax=Variovorax sp. RKNM96 TaxID=2681552 RepID=UPI00197EE2FF|nr:alpha/beta hydrolase family protein [Variovorax sp. RKNM96]